MLFTIKQLIAHVQSTSGQVGNRWVPVRPLQLSGLGGLKQRISHAYRVLKGELDVVDWKVGTLPPRELRTLLTLDTPQELPIGVNPTSIKVISAAFGTLVDQTPIKPKIEWVKCPDVNPYWTSRIESMHGRFILDFNQDTRKVTLTGTAANAVMITYLVE